MQITILDWDIIITRKPHAMTVEEELCRLRPNDWSEKTCRYAIEKVAVMSKEFAKNNWNDPVHMIIPRIKALRAFAAQYGWINDDYIGIKEYKDWVEAHTYMFNSTQGD